MLPFFMYHSCESRNLRRCFLGMRAFARDSCFRRNGNFVCGRFAKAKMAKNRAVECLHCPVDGHFHAIFRTAAEIPAFAGMESGRLRLK
ncbi:MAG: hypothetical protein ACR2QC_07185 [Gammaproteobacteria bacterium]